MRNLGFLLILWPVAIQAATLYVGSEDQMTALGIFTTNGPAVTLQTVVATSGNTHNGVGEGLGLTGIVTGNIGGGIFDTRNLAGGLIASFTPGNNGDEDFAGDGTELWRVHNFTGTILKLDPADGAVLETHPAGFGFVGLTFVGSQLWAASYSTGTVGTFNTSTNTYTSVFTPSLNTYVGALAYDSANGEAAPEPGTLALFSGGLAALAVALSSSRHRPGLAPRQRATRP